MFLHLLQITRIQIQFGAYFFQLLNSLAGLDGGTVQGRDGAVESSFGHGRHPFEVPLSGAKHGFGALPFA